MLVYMARRQLAAQKRKLTAIKQLPVDPPEATLLDFIATWNPGYGQGTTAKELSNLRTYRHPLVEAQWDRIWKLAEAEVLSSSDPNARFEESFRKLAVQVRNGRKI